MSAELAGKTIAVTTRKNMNTDEIVELVRSVFGATSCPRCTSGGFFTLREEVELPMSTATQAKAVMS
jgi:hypothetical protein